MGDRTEARLSLIILDTNALFGASLATRNVGDFEAIQGLNLINPWDRPAA